MIAANKRLIKANLTQGVTGIQNNLINLYASNLSAVATQAALIAGFAFTAVGSYNAPINLEQEVFSYFYVSAYTLCLIAALFVLSQATIVVMFGPSLALKGILKPVCVCVRGGGGDGGGGGVGVGVGVGAVSLL